MRVQVLAIAAAAFTLTAGAASAKVYDFDFFNSTDQGSGAFDVIGSTVQSVTGQVDGFAILGLSPYAASDQQLSPSSAPFVDLSGISFTTALDSYNLYSAPGDMLLKASVDPVGYPSNGQAITLKISAVPEPGSWALMAAGVGMMGLALRSSRKTVLA